jgi:hypothetical protein
MDQSAGISLQGKYLSSRLYRCLIYTFVLFLSYKHKSQRALVLQLRILPGNFVLTCIPRCESFSLVFSVVVLSWTLALLLCYSFITFALSSACGFYIIGSLLRFHILVEFVFVGWFTCLLGLQVKVFSLWYALFQVYTHSLFVFKLWINHHLCFCRSAGTMEYVRFNLASYLFQCWVLSGLVMLDD